jgi:hypothetical protein
MLIESKAKAVRRATKKAVERLLSSITVKSRAGKPQGKRNPVARILTSTDGGPVRRIVNGRQTKYTGFFISVKADFAQMPWESRKGEKATLILAEACSRIVKLLAQPHRLEIFIQEQETPLRYFPDLLLHMHPSLLDDLRKGIPFSAAALAPSKDEPDFRLRKVIVEIKDERDRRQHQKKYKRKLELAQEVYRRLGFDFVIIQRAEDLFPGDLRIASSVVHRRHTDLKQTDVWAVEQALEHGERPAGEIVAVLGDGPRAWAKLRAMHVRRIVALDLSEPVSSKTMVSLPRNNFLKISPST